MNLSKTPTTAKRISDVIKAKLKSNRGAKEGIDLVEFTKNLAQKALNKFNKGEEGDEE